MWCGAGLSMPFIDEHLLIGTLEFHKFHWNKIVWGHKDQYTTTPEELLLHDLKWINSLWAFILILVTEIIKNAKPLKLFSSVLLNQTSIFFATLSLSWKGKNARNTKNSMCSCCHGFYVEVNCVPHWLLPAQNPK